MYKKCKEGYGLIYKVLNIQTHKVYIGQTTHDFEMYINRNISNALKNIDSDSRYFYCSIRKYGACNFKWSILGVCKTKEELNECEIECISFYRSFGKTTKTFDNVYGYNMTKGGESFSGSKKSTRKEIYNRWVLLYGEIEADIKLKTWKENNAKGRTGKGSSLKGQTYETIFNLSGKKSPPLGGG